MKTGGLLELSRALHGASTLADAMDHVVASVEQHTRYRRAWLVLPMSATIGLEVVGYALPDSARVEQRMATLDLEKDPWIRLHLTGTEPMVCNDLRDEPLADQAQVAYFGNRTLISVPMLALADRVGALCVGTFSADGVMPPTQDEIDFVVQVAAMVSVVAGRIRAETAQRALEDKVRGAQRMEALGQMAGGVAHDFNNLLVSILGNADGMREMLGDHPARELLEEIEVAAVRAAHLTRQLLSFSRGLPLQRRDVRVHVVVDGLLPMLRRLLPADIALEATPSKDLPPIFADPGQIEQVIVNLVVNARDALAAGGRILIAIEPVTVGAGDAEAHPGKPPGEYVLLSVTDNGVGMAPEVRANIFEPFFSTKGPGAGTGLGLAVVETILKGHGGFIHCYSEQGLGTTFRVYFPASDQVPAATPGAATPEDGHSTRGTEHVLVVDDDRPVRTLLGRVLSGAGYRVTLAEDGQAALEALAAHTDVAVILSDLVMPRLGGAALRDLLRERPAAPPLILMSGYAPGAEALGAFAHVLSKPFGPRELLRKVREVIDAEQKTARCGT